MQTRFCCKVGVQQLCNESLRELLTQTRDMHRGRARLVADGRAILRALGKHDAHGEPLKARELARQAHRPLRTLRAHERQVPSLGRTGRGVQHLLGISLACPQGCT